MNKKNVIEIIDIFDVLVYNIFDENNDSSKVVLIVRLFTTLNILYITLAITKLFRKKYVEKKKENKLST